MVRCDHKKAGDMVRCDHEKARDMVRCDRWSELTGKWHYRVSCKHPTNNDRKMDLMIGC